MSKAFDASVVYIKNIKLLTMENLIINNSISLRIGVIYLREINLVNANNISAKDTFSYSNAGLFFLFDVSLILNNLNVINSSSNAYGGVFYLNSDSQLTANNIYGNNIKANLGGGFIGINFAINVIINQCKILNIQTNMSGIFAFVLLVKVLSIKETIFNNAFSESGVGLILIKTYDEDAIMNLESIQSFYSSAFEGSFVFFLSNSKLYMRNITIINNNNNVVYISYSFFVDITLEFVTVKECKNSYKLSSFFYFSGIDLYLNNMTFIDNSVDFPIIYFENSHLYIFYVKIFCVILGKCFLLFVNF